MTRVQVAVRRVTQHIHGEALPQTRYERVWRRATPASMPRNSRLFWERVADLIEVALWGVVAMGVVLMIVMLAW